MSSCLLDVLPKRGSPELRLHTVAPYYTMFPLDFPFDILSEANSGEWVLDPFCGRGTTNFAARLRGLPSVGVDASVVAASIARAKLVSVKPEEIVAECRDMLSGSCVEVPEGEFWELAFHQDTLRDICVIRRELLVRDESDVRVALRALMLGVLHGPLGKSRMSYFSNQMPRSYASKPESAVRYWKRHNLVSPPFVDVLELVSYRASYSFSSLVSSSEGYVFHGDSREGIPFERKFKWIVTSPPYLGMKTYIPDQWLRNWFVGGKAGVEYRQEEQLGYGSRDQFVLDLSRVWGSVADVSLPGAVMVVRFGVLPGRKEVPFEVFMDSVGSIRWRVFDVRSAGSALAGKRQSLQFGRSLGSAQEEIDIFLVLEG